MAHSCRRDAAALIYREAQKFCDQEPPETQKELSRRQQQSMYLTSRISSIAHADSMARIHPGVAAEILRETKAFCERLGLDDKPFKEAMALTSTISSLCHSDFMQRL